MTELRHHDRINLDRAIAIRLSNGQIVRARLVSLSAGGLGVLYPAPGELGTTLGLHFQLSDKNNEPVTIHCEGIVRQTHMSQGEFITGLEFSRISDDDRSVIQQFIHRKRAGMNLQVMIK